MSFKNLFCLLQEERESFTEEEFKTINDIFLSAESRRKQTEEQGQLGPTANVSNDGSKKPAVHLLNAEAEKHKEEGNKFFKNKQYDDAIFAYTEAIQTDPDNKIYYSNRAAAYAMLGMKDNGIDDCLRAIQIDDGYVKAYIRLGDFYAGDNDEEALENYNRALLIEPENSVVKEKIGVLEKKGKDLNLKDMMNNPDIADMVNNLCKNKSKDELEKMLGDILKHKK